MAKINLSQLGNRVKKYKADYEKVAKASLIRVGSQVVTRTPVDTGRAKGNWNSAYGAPDTSTDENRRVGDSLGDLRVSIEGLEVGTVFYFTNNLPYIHRLEYEGWSEQAPQGMLRLSTQQFPQIVEEEARKVRK